MTIRMDEGAAELLDTLHKAGYAAYVVGGCVRDSLLGLTPHDWDLCTSALPQQVMELFGAQRCIPHRPAARHGNGEAERCPLRDHHLPYRRHLTQMAATGRGALCAGCAGRIWPGGILPSTPWPSMKKEGLVDPFGGQADLQVASVRAVGVPASGSPRTRCASCGCTASQPGLALPSTRPRRRRHRSYAHLDCVSVERIEEELAKLLSAPAPCGISNKKNTAC